MSYVTYEGLFAFMSLLIAIICLSFEFFQYYSRNKFLPQGSNPLYEKEKPPREVDSSNEEEKNTNTQKK